MNNPAHKKTTKQTSVFDKGQVIGLHRAGKSAKEVSEMMAIQLRIVQRTIAQWKKDEVQSFSGNGDIHSLPTSKSTPKLISKLTSKPTLKTMSKPTSKTRSRTTSKTMSKSISKPKTRSKPKPQSEPKPQSKSKPKPKPQSKSTPKSKPKPQPKSKPKPQSKYNPKPQSKYNPKPPSKPKPDFPCSHCSEVLQSTAALRKHLFVHGIRPFPCRHCVKSFKDRFARDTHERTHTGEKPHACILCPRAFNERGNLRKHCKTVHDFHYPPVYQYMWVLKE